MSKILELINALMPRFQSQQQMDDARLAQSSDISELERRMTEIQRQAVHRSHLWAFMVSSA
jgi:hypothetical protein